MLKKVQVTVTMQSVVCISVIVAVILPGITCLSCPKWEPGLCESLAEEYPCDGLEGCPEVDRIDDYCSCCPVCARQEGQQCGGIYEGSPVCGQGLKCHKPALRADELEYNQDGVCVKDLSEEDKATLEEEKNPSEELIGSEEEEEAEASGLEEEFSPDEEPEVHGEGSGEAAELGDIAL